MSESTIEKNSFTLCAELNEATEVSEAAKIKATLDEIIKEENKALKLAEAVRFASMENRAEMFRNFINEPGYTMKKLAQDKDTGVYSIADKNGELSFKDIEAAYCGLDDGNKTLANSVKYCHMVSLFIHNCYRNYRAEVSGKKNGGEATTLKLNSKFADEMAEYGFKGYSIGDLEKQLNAIFAEILPAEVKIVAKRADVRQLIAIVKENKKGTTTDLIFRNEATMLMKMFGVMRVRMHNYAYTVESKADAHKAK